MPLLFSGRRFLGLEPGLFGGALRALFGAERRLDVAYRAARIANLAVGATVAFLRQDVGANPLAAGVAAAEQIAGGNRRAAEAQQQRKRQEPSIHDG